MNCPKCSSAHTMSTTKNESIVSRFSFGGHNYARTEKEEKSVTHRCLDCGHEWRDEG
jgi:Zn ribbon nucleic-acid-binding protein